MICHLSQIPTFLVFSSGLTPLFYYTHISVAILALFVGIVVLLRGRHFLLNRILFTFTALFSIWAVLNIIAWTNIHSEIILFVWSFFGIISALIALLCVYFVSVFLEKKDISFNTKMIFLVLLAPIIFISPTNIYLSGINLTSCDAFDFEGNIVPLYYTILGAISAVWIFILLFIAHRKTDNKKTREEILLLGLGMESLLFLFFGMEMLAFYLTKVEFLQNLEIKSYGLFGIAILIVFFERLVAQSNEFNIKVFIMQILITAIASLVGAHIFLVSGIENKILVIFTFILVCIILVMLWKDGKKEIIQLENIKEIERKLESANTRLRELDLQKSEFLSIATHQLRGPLAAIRGHLSLLIEGEYGEITDKIKDVLAKISTSSVLMVETVNDFLDVSRIEQGTMRYEMADFSICDLLKNISEELTPSATERNLKINCNLLKENCFIINADYGKIRHIFFNLVDNAIKYTPSGTIEISSAVNENLGTGTISIKDTGIGISPEKINTLFHKFIRVRETSSINIDGTGLGLYVAKQIVDAHNGTVWVESDGLGKGSTFFVKLPLGCKKKISECEKIKMVTRPSSSAVIFK